MTPPPFGHTSCPTSRPPKSKTVGVHPPPMWNGVAPEDGDFDEQELRQLNGITDYSSWYDVTGPRGSFRPPSLRNFIEELWESNGKPGLQKATEPLPQSAPERLRTISAGVTPLHPPICP
eukprot:3963574-Prymnesium_polylepis.2